MMNDNQTDWTSRPDPLPAKPGAGFKPQHMQALLEDPQSVAFIEVHAENYMGAGGHPRRMLTSMREAMPLSIHGVGLSIGAESGLDPAHLDRLAALVERYQPAMVSEHLAWSTHGGIYFNDLLPLPYDETTLERVVTHVCQVQDRLRRRILIENPSTYLEYACTTMSETEFLTEIAERSGCGLLLDINNVHVSTTNRQESAIAWLAEFPLDKIGEIHLAGHAEDVDEAGQRLLIDAHDRAVADQVWTLYERVISLTGPLPTLIEWDNDVPDWPVLAREANRAADILKRYDSRRLLGARHG